MIYRCLWPSNPGYALCGGRGITVHDPWRDFARFLEDMGPCPSGYMLGRLDAKLSFTPANTRWMSRSEWQRRRERGRRLDYRGECHTVIEWSEKLGIHADTIRSRLKRGWDVAQVLGFEPPPKAVTGAR